jgi:Uma2 family endonuclease
MIEPKIKPERKQKKVPESLIYEMMDGKPIYYHGYQYVLNKKRKPEDITGSSSLQAILVSYIVSLLAKALNENDYWIMTNEAGVHLDHKNNLAGDIMIYEKTRLKPSDINNQYVKIPANVVIEVDTKADLTMMKFEEYLKKKTTKFHAFGVDKIIWILTAARQVVIALPNQDWLLIDWNKDIEIMNGITFNIGGYLTKNGIELTEEE